MGCVVCDCCGAYVVAGASSQSSGVLLGLGCSGINLACCCSSSRAVLSSHGSAKPVRPRQCAICPICLDLAQQSSLCQGVSSLGHLWLCCCYCCCVTAVCVGHAGRGCWTPQWHSADESVDQPLCEAAVAIATIVTAVLLASGQQLQTWK